MSMGNVSTIFEQNLPSAQGPCTTLRLLVLPSPPPRGMVQLVGNGCGERSSLGVRLSLAPVSWGMEAEFCSRVRETFPNLINMTKYSQIGLEMEVRQESERLGRK